MKTILNGEAINEIIESQLIQAFEKSMGETWRSGIDDIVKRVVSQNSDAIEEKYSKILKKVLTSDGFEKAITEEFRHKVAKNMVAKLEGQVEQAVNVIRQDQTLRAKMVVAIEKIIEDNHP